MAVVVVGSEENTAATPSPPRASTAKPFEKPPMVAAENQASTIASVPGLIQPTNAKERTNKCRKGGKIHLRCFVQAVETVQTRRHAQELFPGYPAALLKP